jgi:glucosamine-6-phosphate deaminase
VEVVVGKNAEAAAQLATGRAVKWIRSNPHTTVMPATGNSPLLTYDLLAQQVREGLDTSGLRIFQLDEYVGVSGSDPRSLYGWMYRTFLEPLHILPWRVTRLRGDVPDLQRSCDEYEAAVKAAGGIGLAILGLGLDGHLGYNEPPSLPDAPTRVVTLRPESKSAAATYWPPGAVTPDQGITAGMDIILRAQAILLLVTGAAKRSILREVLDGPIGPDVPASYLREVNGATVVADREAIDGQ